MSESATAERPAVSFIDVPPAREVPSLAEDARRGLAAPPRVLPSKYFYDDAGSLLFDRICDTPEYYPTRTETALLERHAGQVIERVRPATVIELGSGTCRKSRLLLDACEALDSPVEFRPFDVCREVLELAAEDLGSRFEWLSVKALVGDYTAGLDHLPVGAGPRLFVFLGGTIGNFTRPEAVAFLRELRSLMGAHDALLLGADRVKDPAVLHAAYNDAAGLTARFNLNVLEVLNRELAADFDPGAFRHHACFNPAERRIEMYLIPARAMTVRVDALGLELELDEAEAILTELSHKFTAADLERLLADAGLYPAEHFSPPDEAFSLLLARPA